MSISHSRDRRLSTPSSILRKTPNLKTRLSLVSQKSPKVRFELPHSKRVQNIFQDYVENSVSRDYEQLVCLIRDAELLDSDVLSILKEAVECISLLNKDLKLFVEALLYIDWTGRSESVVKEYHNFIVNLLTAHNYHAKFVISRLVALFLPDSSSTEWPNGEPTEIDAKKCANVHILIKKLLNVVPMCRDMLLHFITIQYPYYNKPSHDQEHFQHNLLLILSYEPSLRDDILYLLFSKLVVMDVNAPKADIEKCKTADEDEMFTMDDDSKSVRTAFTNVNRHNVGHSLDICLDQIFNYIITECHKVSGELDWERTVSLYNDMVKVFDKVILPTYNINHVQFAMFVLCAVKDTVAEAFLNYLWKKVCNPNVAPVLRQASVTYIASFIARATYVPIMLVKATLQQMTEWIHVYILNQDGLECVNSDIRVHSVFYSVCQALFYIISFKHKELVKSKKNVSFLGSLNLAKIVTCRLNPLRVCQSAVVQNFAAITRKYQLAYCYTIIEHNLRNTLPTIYQDDKGSAVISNNVLSDYFPFDPYILERSGEKVISVYKDYEDNYESMEVDNKDSIEVDDFLENRTEPTSSDNHKFSYGSSPGFKYKGLT